MRRRNRGGHRKDHARVRGEYPGGLNPQSPLGVYPAGPDCGFVFELNFITGPDREGSAKKREWFLGS